MSESTIVREDDSFVDAHGVRIHYYRWRAAQPKAAVQLVHNGQLLLQSSASTCLTGWWRRGWRK